MDISLSLVWANSSNYIREKMAIGLTPMQKKIAIIAAALFFACYLTYRCYKYFFSARATAVDGNLKQSRTEIGQQGVGEKLNERPASVDGSQKPITQGPVKKSLTPQEKLEKNKKFALEQQQNEASKGFKIIPGDIPESLEFLVQNRNWGGDHWDRVERDLHGENKTINKMSVGIASCQGPRSTMEDADLATEGSIDLKDGPHPFELFGVFDGHGGDEASAFVKKNLTQYLIAELEKHCNEGLTDEGIVRALKACCVQLDADYDSLKDGTTATIALILDGKIWIANVGDARTILVKDGKALQASEDAKLNIERYLATIKKLGGFVIGGRVNGGLAVARAIGDKGFKGSTNECCVSAHPKITCYPADFDYAVLACDGLYDAATTNEVGQGIQEMHADHETTENMAKRLVYSALRSERSRDNVSVIVIKR